MSGVSYVTSTPYSPPPASVLIDTTEVSDAADGSVTQTTTNGKNVDQVASDFEAVFLTQMMQQMFAGEELTSFFGGGTAGEVYKSYLLNEYGKSIAKAGGIGIAEQVKKELLKLQELQQ